MKTMTGRHENHDVSAVFGVSFVMKTMTSLIYHLPMAYREGADHDDR